MKRRRRQENPSSEKHLHIAIATVFTLIFLCIFVLFVQAKPKSKKRKTAQKPQAQIHQLKNKKNKVINTPPAQTKKNLDRKNTKNNTINKSNHSNKSNTPKKSTTKGLFGQKPLQAKPTDSFIPSQPKVAKFQIPPETPIQNHHKIASQKIDTIYTDSNIQKVQIVAKKLPKFLLFPLHSENNNEPGKWISFAAMYRATYIPSKALANNFITFSNSKRYWKMSTEEWTSKENQKIMRQYYEADNYGEGKIQQTKDGYTISVMFYGENKTKKRFRKTFHSEKLHLAPSWLAQAIHHYLGTKLSQEEKVFLKQRGYQDMQTFYYAADCTQKYFDDNPQNNPPKHLVDRINANAIANFYGLILLSGLKEELLSSASQMPLVLTTELLKKYPQHDFLKACLADNCYRFNDYPTSLDYLWQVLEKDISCEYTLTTLTQIYDKFKCLEDLEPLMKIINETLPNSGIAKASIGDFFINYAWEARGGGYANSVDQKSWQTMRERITVADAFLRKAYEENPCYERISTLMITVCLGKPYPPMEMEKWFQRAIQFYPDYRKAYDKKLYYLYPRWFGTVEQCLAFSSQVAEYFPPGSNLRFILIGYLQELSSNVPDAKEYYRQPEIWDVIHKIYTEHLQVYPEHWAKRNDYAWYAYRVEKWDICIEELAIIAKNNQKLFFENWSNVHKHQKQLDKIIRESWNRKQYEIAVRGLLKGLRSVPHNTKWRNELVKLWDYLGEKQQAWLSLKIMKDDGIQLNPEGAARLKTLEPKVDKNIIVKPIKGYTLLLVHYGDIPFSTIQNVAQAIQKNLRIRVYIQEKPANYPNAYLINRQDAARLDQTCVLKSNLGAAGVEGILRRVNMKWNDLDTVEGRKQFFNLYMQVDPKAKTKYEYLNRLPRQQLDCNSLISQAIIHNAQAMSPTNIGGILILTSHSIGDYNMQYSYQQIPGAAVISSRRRIMEYRYNNEQVEKYFIQQSLNSVGAILEIPDCPTYSCPRSNVKNLRDNLQVCPICLVNLSRICQKRRELRKVIGMDK